LSLLTCVLFIFYHFHRCWLQVKELASENAQVNAEGHAVVVEIARLLLEAGAEQDENDSMRSMFVLLNATKDSLDHMKSAVVVTMYFDLIAELVKLFRKHGLDDQRRYTLNLVIAAMDHIERFDRVAGMSIGFSGRPDLMNAAMDGLAAVFHCFNADGAAMFSVDAHHQVIIRTFSTIAAYSSRLGHSDRMLLLIEDALGVNQMSKLRNLLSKRLEFRPVSCELRAYITKALEWFSGVELPHRLQDLARSAIRRTIRNRELPSAAELGIPKELVKSLAF